MTTATAPVTYPPLGAAITARRDDIGMSRTRLAELAGISTTDLLHIERGNVTIASRTLALIAAGLRTETWLLQRRAFEIYRQATTDTAMEAAS
jgi:transcriptional regulator with XRE-family HTH domain